METIKLSIDQLKSPTSASIIASIIPVLEAGGLVIFPTETVYGALVDALNPQAVQKLLQFKKRRPGKPLSIACCDQEMAAKYVKINDQAQKIYQSFLPGPFTVISHSLDQVSPGIVSEFNTIGIRIPDYPLLLDLIRAYGRPLTATSANSTGKKTPYQIEDILSNLSKKQTNLIDLIVDAGQLPPNPPSVVIDTTQTTPIYMRTAPESTESESTKSKILSTNQPPPVEGGANLSHDYDKKETFTSTSPQETQDLAAKLLFRHFDQLAESGLIITLDGELGAGKTTFTQGLGTFLHLDQPLSSPTYTYLKEYPFTKNDLAGHLFHFDVWKINDQAQLSSLQIPSLLAPKNLIIIEWWQQIAPFAAPILDLSSPQSSTLHLHITELPDHNRQIHVYSRH